MANTKKLLKLGRRRCGHSGLGHRNIGRSWRTEESWRRKGKEGREKKVVTGLKFNGLSFGPLWPALRLSLGRVRNRRIGSIPRFMAQFRCDCTVSDSAHCIGIA
ncbi:hypothetical protein CRG98_039740 [Punica granatum]|uniref:Uncharacterized protein n=1 Tax=Punica granatum TaxID=22663 RepID=A0A2I0I792_PUNGR|nr:hypothetical protein CRG98_039740 [Punica granatum]